MVNQLKVVLVVVEEVMVVVAEVEEDMVEVEEDMVVDMVDMGVTKVEAEEHMEVMVGMAVNNKEVLMVDMEEVELKTWQQMQWQL